MAIKSDPASAAAKFQRRVSQAGPDYSSGVQKSAGWANAAMASKPRRDAGLLAAIQADSINKGIQAAGDAKWRGNTLAKGAPAWTAAAPRAAQAYQAAAAKTFGYLANAQQAIANMPNDSVSARLERARVHAMSLYEQARQAKGLPA